MSIEIIPHWIAPRRQAFLCKAEDLQKYAGIWASSNVRAENFIALPSSWIAMGKKPLKKRKHRSLWIKARAGK